MAVDPRNEPSIAGSGDAYRVCADGNLVVLVWTGQPSLAGVRALDAELRATAARQPARIGFFTLIQPDAIRSSPEPSVRQATAAVLKTWNTRIGAAVIVYEERGVKATILRSVIMIINALAGSAFPNRVYADARDGARWLVAALGRDAPADAEVRLGELLAQRRTQLSRGG